MQSSDPVRQSRDDQLRFVVVGGGYKQLSQYLRQGINGYNELLRYNNQSSRIKLAEPLFISDYDFNKIKGVLIPGKDIVVVTLREDSWSLGGLDKTPRRLCASIELAYALCGNETVTPTVVLATSPIYDNQRDPQYTGLCVLAWICSGVSGVVDYYHLGLGTVIRDLITLHLRNKRGQKRSMLIGGPSNKLEAFKDTSFNQRRYAFYDSSPYELPWRGAFRAAMAIAQLDTFPLGKTKSGKKSWGTPTMAAALNALSESSLFEYHVGGLDDIILRLEKEWCEEDIDSEIYFPPKSRILLPHYARNQGGFPRHQPIVRSIEHKEVPGLLYQALNEIDLLDKKFTDDIPQTWHSIPNCVNRIYKEKER